MEKEPAVEFRTYAASDKKDCIDVFKSNIPEYFVEKELADFDVWLNRQEERPDSQKETQEYLVVVLENRIAGCGGFHIDLVNRSARMTWGMISRHLHRKGLGKQFLLHRIERIQVICPDCAIALDTTQHAAPFFEKLGFRTTKITPDFYAPGMDRYDMVL